jgi:flagella basal body P-ring formation protein FlgA
MPFERRRAGYRTPLGKIALGVPVLLLFPPSPGEAAQTVEPDTMVQWEAPQKITDEVRSRIAEEWHVGTADVHLEWGSLRPGQTLEDMVVVDLLGGGRSGQWVASLLRPGDEEDRASLPLRAGVTHMVPFARKPLSRGDVLEPGTMEYRPHVQWGPPSQNSPPAETGWVAQRRIEAGTPLTSPAVRPPQLVVSGRPVQLIWASGALRISLQGEAVGSAAMGERVYVRTEQGHRMAGIVTGPGTVLLSSPGTGGER